MNHWKKRFLKLARLARDPKHLDSQVDVAGYDQRRGVDRGKDPPAVSEDGKTVTLTLGLMAHRDPETLSWSDEPLFAFDAGAVLPVFPGVGFTGAAVGMLPCIIPPPPPPMFPPPSPPRGDNIFISLATISVVYLSLPFWSCHLRV